MWTANNPYCDEKRLERRLVTVGGHRIDVRQAWRDDGKGGTEIGFGACVYNSAIVLAHELTAGRPAVPALCRLSKGGLHPWGGRVFKRNQFQKLY